MADLNYHEPYESTGGSISCSCGWPFTREQWKNEEYQGHLAAIVLKPFEALADEWQASNILTPESRYTRDVLVRELRAAIEEARRGE